MCESSEYTKNTRSCNMTWTGHDRQLYNQYRSLPTTLCTSYIIMCESSEYTKNTRSCTITWTGHDRRLYNQYRSLPTTLCTSYTIMCESSEYTKNTRLCTMTWTGHDRWLYQRLTLLLGLRSTGIGIWYDDHGRALPTVRIIVPSSRMVSVRPNNNRTINIRLICDCIIPAYRANYDTMVLSCYANTLSPIWQYTSQQHKSIRVFTYTHSKGPSASLLTLWSTSDIFPVV